MSIELKLENIEKSDVLKDINLDLKGGTITALIGENGSGKTTLLKSIFGLVDYKGNINVNGIIVNEQNIEDTRKNFGIFLGINTLENTNVFSNLMLPLINLNYIEEEAKKIVYEVTKKLGIENLLYKEIEKLSYSQKKVVAFAKSIIHLPSIILIDNLFESLDLFYRNKIINYLKKITKSKKCIVIFTTNNCEDILLSDYLIILKKGKIKKFGETKELIKDENIFIKNKLKLPFIVDLSHKLKAYEILDDVIYDIDEMVDEIWK